MQSAPWCYSISGLMDTIRTSPTYLINKSSVVLYVTHEARCFSRRNEDAGSEPQGKDDHVTFWPLRKNPAADHFVPFHLNSRAIIRDHQRSTPPPASANITTNLIDNEDRSHSVAYYQTSRSVN